MTEQNIKDFIKSCDWKSWLLFAVILYSTTLLAFFGAVALFRVLI